MLHIADAPVKETNTKMMEQQQNYFQIVSLINLANLFLIFLKFNMDFEDHWTIFNGASLLRCNAEVYPPGGAQTCLCSADWYLLFVEEVWLSAQSLRQSLTALVHIFIDLKHIEIADVWFSGRYFPCQKCSHVFNFFTFSLASQPKFYFIPV